MADRRLRARRSPPNTGHRRAHLSALPSTKSGLPQMLNTISLPHGFSHCAALPLLPVGKKRKRATTRTPCGSPASTPARSSRHTAMAMRALPPASALPTAPVDSLSALSARRIARQTRLRRLTRRRPCSDSIPGDAQAGRARAATVTFPRTPNSTASAECAIGTENRSFMRLGSC